MSHDTTAAAGIDDLCALAAHLAGAAAARVLPPGGVAAGGSQGLSLTAADGADLGTLVLDGGDPQAPHLGTAVAAIALALEAEALRSEAFEAAEVAASSRELLSEAAGQLVHDVNNPLAAAAMALEIARDEVDEPLVAGLLDRAVNSTTRMKTMVTDLLAFSAPRVPGQAHLRAALERVITSFAGLPAGSIDLPAAGSVDEEVLVALRPGDLDLVLVALVDNVVKFARQDESLSARIEVLETEEGVRVTFVDAGRGIDPAERERVLLPTVRLDRRVPGMGLGLATVRRLVEGAGGSVGVDDSALGGVSVWFELPAVPRDTGV